MERIELVLQEQKQEVIREKYNIPKVVELRIPKRGEKLINPLVGTVAMCPKFLHCGLRLFCKIVAFSRGFISDMGKSWSTCAHITGTLEMFQAQESRITQENMRAVLWGDQPKVSAQVRSNIRGAPLNRRPYTDLLSLESFQAIGLVALHEASLAVANYSKGREKYKNLWIKELARFDCLGLDTSHLQGGLRQCLQDYQGE
ncbi:hypothetical protein WN943_013507 [Citrus x changshan-huyou]